MYAVVGTCEIYTFGIVPGKRLRIGNPFLSGVFLVQRQYTDVEIDGVPEQSRFGEIASAIFSRSFP